MATSAQEHTRKRPVTPDWPTQSGRAQKRRKLRSESPLSVHTAAPPTLVSKQLHISKTRGCLVLDGTEKRVSGLLRVLELYYYFNYRHKWTRHTKRHGPPCTADEGKTVEREIEAYYTQNKTPQHPFAARFCEWAAEEHLIFVASQFCVYDPQANIGTFADFIMRHEDTGRFVLVELKCGYGMRFRACQGRLAHEMSSVGNCRKNHCFLQLMWMHYILRTKLYPGTHFDTRLVVINWIYDDKGQNAHETNKETTEGEKKRRRRPRMPNFNTYTLPKRLLRLEQRMYEGTCIARRNPVT